jgi:hypothetical protein
MLVKPLASHQLNIIQNSQARKVFLEGPAGAGKTTTGVEWVLNLMSQGERGDSILLMLPQRTLAEPYLKALRHPGVTAGGMVSPTTIGGLAQRLLDIFWPLVSEEAGFSRPDAPPVFLTLESAQYFMARLTSPLMEQGFFDGVTLQRSRLYSQILDNLNKAAGVRFPYTEIGRRLKSAWIGEPGQLKVYDSVQHCAERFRSYCLDNNLLDFSLQLEVFVKHLWPQPLCQEYFYDTYHHLVVDNLEEDIPIAHDMLLEWLPRCDSALMIYDCEGGYRSFLGADPESARSIKDLCGHNVEFSTSFITSRELLNFSNVLGKAICSGPAFTRPTQGLAEPSASRRATTAESVSRVSFNNVLVHEDHHYFPQMIEWISSQIAALVYAEGVSPGEIVVLAPFLTDALRFSLTDGLHRQNIAVRSHRPSRALREEPAAQSLITLALLAHPQWAEELAYQPTRFDVAYALMQAVEGMDLVRAQILAENVFRLREACPTLTAFDALKPESQERITFSLGSRYQRLFEWLEAYMGRPEDEIDYFFSRLFGEVLSQPGFGFHESFHAGEVAANLVESARKFRWAVSGAPPKDECSLGMEYVRMVQDGVVAAQYVLSWRSQPEDAVLLAPAYTYLMSNRPVDIQFWLDIGSRGWFERLDQPLTHPYVLSRGWPLGTIWTDEDEYTSSQEALSRLAVGLARRCRRKIYLGFSRLNEQGFEHQGPLLKAIQKVLRQSSAHAYSAT